MVYGRKELRTFNEQEEKAFYNLFVSKEYKTNRLYESIGSKLYRHEYCLVGNELVDEVVKWLKYCGLKVKVHSPGSYQTIVELV